MSKIAVLPTKPSAEKLVHPVDGVLGKGKPWTYDTFTMRRLSDGSIVRGEPAAAAQPAPAETAVPAATPAAPVSTPAPAAPPPASATPPAGK